MGDVDGVFFGDGVICSGGIECGGVVGGVGGGKKIGFR